MHLLSLTSLNTFLPSLGSKLPGLGITLLALGGKTPVPQRSCKSAKPSLVPSASTTTVPYQPGSMNKPVCGMAIRGGGMRVRSGP
jgi:hypothetical protein